jgi:PAS domain S-box-containing protein
MYENAPKLFTSATGQPEGIFIDIIKNIAQSEGWRLQFVHGSWAEGLHRLDRGEIDLMPDVIFTAERATKYAFHRTPVLSAWDQIYVAKNSGIKSILDLDGKRIAMLEGSVQGEAFKQLVVGYGLNVSILPMPEYQTAFEMVAKGQADGVLTNNYYGSLHYRKLGLESTAILMNPSALFFAAPKGKNQDLLNAIDLHLMDLKDDPQSVYFQTLKRWAPEEDRFVIPPWLKVLSLVVGVSLLLSIIGSVILKRQVNARTKALSEQNALMIDINRALNDSVLKHRTLFETADCAILLLREGRIVDCNARTLALFGCSSEQILGTYPFEISPPTQKDGQYSKEIALAKVHQALRGQPQLFEWEHCRWDRTPFTAEVSLNCLELSGEVFLQAIVRDISERKQAESDRIAREAAEEASRAKSAFVANMSHEIRTPLNAIIGFAQILERDPALTPQQADHVRTVSRSGMHLLQLINDILDMSRIEAGRITLNKSVFCLHDLLNDLATMFRFRAESKGLQLHIEWDDNVPQYVTADEGKLRQVLVNIIGNAIKFTETGGVAVRMRADMTEGTSTEGTASLRLLTEVEDTGPGIPEEDLDRIFEAFQQAETGMKVGGTGLGLAISREFVAMMGGELTVKSQVGKGTCFRFDVLLKPADAISAQERLTVRRVVKLESDAAPLRVLVVDDILTNRTMLCALLRPLGFEVAEASNGAEAVKVFEQWSPQAILMDLRMPVMDGYEATRQIKSTETGHATAIIAVTASAFEDYKEQVMAAGADAFLRKPFRPEELYEELGKCLDLHYIYADEPITPSTLAKPATDKPVSVTSLPQELAGAMKQAVADGDMIRLGALITQVEAVDINAARALHALAERYDYQRIDEWLQKGDTDHG